VQFCGEGLTLDDEGQWVQLKNLEEYLLAKPSLGQWLEALRSQLPSDEVRRSIWLVHCPPADLGMDICGDGQRVGSPTILRFIKDTQLLLGCSGHIHESPHQSGGQWAARVGRTIWVQPGQTSWRLHYSSLEIGNDLEITSATHSLFGSMPI
jgi:Icc-related predicted phosphoesterase